MVVIGFTEHRDKLNIDKNKFIEIGSKNDIGLMAKRIYTLLRKADNLKSKIILIEGIERKDLGIAIMNRLLRTCEYDYLEG